MFELLKKIGLPSVVAAVVALLVTVVPLMFKIDDRYAHDADLTALEKKVDALAAEVGQLAGTQQVLVTVISASLNRTEQVVRRVEVQAAPTAASLPFDPNTLPPTGAGPASAGAGASPEPRVTMAPPPAPTPAPTTVLVKPMNVPATNKAQTQLEEVTKSLAMTQQRVEAIKSNKK